MVNFLNLRQVWKNCLEFYSNRNNSSLETEFFTVPDMKEYNETKHMVILATCLDISQEIVSSTNRDSELANKICDTCANICDVCAEYYEQINEPNKEECITFCKNCAAKCRKMPIF